MNLTPWRSKRSDGSGAGRTETGLARLRSEIDTLFDRFFEEPWRGLAEWPFGGRFGPRVDLSETEDSFCVTAELPGVDPKDVDISVSGNILTLRGEKKQERQEKGRNYYRTERQYGSFQRSIPLPSSVDSDKVEASYKDGVLTITLAKRAEARPKRITVKEG